MRSRATASPSLRGSGATRPRCAGASCARRPGRRRGAGRPPLLQLAVEALRELTLVVVVQRRGERVLPLPDRERPGERADARHDHQRAEDAERAFSSAFQRLGLLLRLVAAAGKRAVRDAAAGPRDRTSGNGGVAAGDERRELCRDREPDEAEQHRDPRDVADRDE